MLRLWMYGLLVGLCINIGKASQCSSSGRFLNDAVPNCRGYTMCIESVNGIYIQYNLTCPPTFIFSPLDNVCTNVTSYKCLKLNTPFNCSHAGSFEYPSSENCSTFIVCIEGLNGLSPILVECPSGTLFDPVKGTCVGGTAFTCIKETDVLEILEPSAESPVDTEMSSHNSAENNAVGIFIYAISFVVVNKRILAE